MAFNLASRLVVLRQRVTAVIHSAFKAHGSEVAPVLTGRLNPFLEEGETAFDFLQLQRVLGRMVAASLERVIAADKAHADELTNDIAPRQQRDGAVEAVRQKLIEVRRIVQGLFGEERAVEVVAVDGSTARQPEHLWRQGEHTVSRLRDPLLLLPTASTGAIAFDAVKLALRRLKKKGAVATPYRGFYIIVPPEYQHLECLPAEQFIPQLMEHLDIPYYAGLLTAARYHGAAHQQPQVFQVIVARNRPPIRCGQVAVAFVARHNACEIPTVRLNTPRGTIDVSSPEASAFDLVGYPRHCGGLSNVATVLVELGEDLDPNRLVSLAPLSPLPWAQRLGYLLDFVGHRERTEPLAEYVRSSVTETVPLSLMHEATSAERDQRWRLAINVGVEPDL